MEKRTDLALEAREIWSERRKTPDLDGAETEEKDVSGFHVTTVRIKTESAAAELCKPIGTYTMIELGRLMRRDDGSFRDGVAALGDALRGMLGLSEDMSVLVVGLGNTEVTPDAFGPLTLKSTLVTRHLRERYPDAFGVFRSVAALEPGVLGATGIESAAVIRAVAEKIRPDAVVAVDALAARRMPRLLTTVQLADTGIVPGSGVGNARDALNRGTLGIPVVAVGVPTVVDAATLAADIAEEAGAGEESAALMRDFETSMIVTPKDIDAGVREMARFAGYAINHALQESMDIADMDMFLG